MTDRIRIETQEQADAVPPYSRCSGDSGAAFRSTAAPIGYNLTHVAIPVAQAIEARRVLLLQADAIAHLWPVPIAGRAIHDELTGIADRIIPPPLADAAEQQAKPALPDWLNVGLVRLLGSLDDDEWTALRAHVQGFVEYTATLDAEGRQG